MTIIFRIMLGLWMAAGFNLAQAQTKTTTATKAKSTESPKKVENQDLIAHFETNLGAFDVKLFAKQAPITVSNFVELARAGKYNGVIFHRVIPGFMIQGGDPEGTGRGGPGYTFQDEFNKELRHSKPGMLSMANAGPNTNGSQFFVTVAQTSYLDDRHAVFGEVVKGYDVVEAISKVKASNDRPVDPVKMTKVEIVGEFTPVEFKKIRR